MSDTAKRDPRIPGPATKPVREKATASSGLAPSGGRHSLDAAATAGTPGTRLETVEPLDAIPAGERHPLDDAPTAMTPPDPLKEDDPWTRAENAPDPLGLEQEVDFWDPDETEDEFRGIYDSRNYDDDDDTGYRAQAGGVFAQGAEMIRRNPVGTGLVLAGLALLAAPRLERESVERHYRGVRDDTRGHLEGHRRKAQSSLREARSRLDRMRAQLADGTEDMSAEARRRVVAARERALEASERARTGAAEGTAKAGGMIRANPMATGAIALAIGAVAGAAMPRTEIEDSRLGRLSDRLMDEARTVYEEERARIMAGASAAAQELREMGRDVAQGARESVPDGKDAVERSKDALRDGVGRVVSAAKEGHDNGSAPDTTKS